MSRIVEVLDESRFIDHLSTVTEGRSAITRIGMVELPGKGPRECYIKTYPTIKEVFNEITGFLIAKSLTLPCSPSAGVIILPWQLFNYHPALESPLSRLSWLTETVPGTNPTTLWTFPNNSVPDEFLRDLARWDKTHHTVAKDDWTGNVDRNAGNLLRLGRGKYVLIDHGHLYSSNQWIGSQLCTSSANTKNKLQLILWGLRPVPKQDAGLIVELSREHHLAYARIKDELQWWAEQLLTDMDRSFALNYIEQRALNAVPRLGTHYGVLGL